MTHLTEYITNLNKKAPEPEVMDLDEAFDLVIEHALNRYAQLRVIANPECVDDQYWLSRYKTAIDTVDEYWMNLP